MQPLMLEGQVVDPLASRLTELEEENKALRRELAATQRQVIEAKTEAARSVAKLRQTLTPLYQSFKMLFGEMEAIGGTEDSPATSSPRKNAGVWEAWKSRLSGTCAKVIDALQTHGELNTQQLAIATGLHRTTIPKAIYELNKAGLISKNGGRFSLKEL